MAVFIDTGAFMAYRNKKDVYHSAADDLVRRALKGEVWFYLKRSGAGRGAADQVRSCGHERA